MNMLTKYGIHLHTRMFIHQIENQTIFLHRSRPVILWEYELKRLVFISDLSLPLNAKLRLGFIIHDPHGPTREVYGTVMWKESSTSVKAYQYGVLIEPAAQELPSMTKHNNRNFPSGRGCDHNFECYYGSAQEKETGHYFDVTT